MSQLPSNPPVPSPVTNKRLDTPPPSPTDYLADIWIGPLGDYCIKSYDPKNMYNQTCRITINGDHRYIQEDPMGNVSDNHPGGHKFAAASETRTNLGHMDDVKIGGERVVNQQGTHREHGQPGGVSEVSQSVHIDSSADTHTTLATDGHGHHVVSGDQTWHVTDGGMHYEVDQDYTISV